MLSLNGKPKRLLGQIVLTRNARERLDAEEVTAALMRHMKGDDGELDEYIRREPECSALDGCRFLSVYRASDGGRFWIITEADRSFTTVLLPEDF
jgi:hypothetical protein